MMSSRLASLPWGMIVVFWIAVMLATFVMVELNVSVFVFWLVLAILAGVFAVRFLSVARKRKGGSL